MYCIQETWSRKSSKQNRNSNQNGFKLFQHFTYFFFLIILLFGRKDDVFCLESVGNPHGTESLGNPHGTDTGYVYKRSHFCLGCFKTFWRPLSNWRQSFILGARTVVKVQTHAGLFYSWESLCKNRLQSVHFSRVFSQSWTKFTTETERSSDSSHIWRYHQDISSVGFEPLSN